MPILVAATEIGYGYAGNGTDFWPRLGQRLGRSLAYVEQLRISHWFAEAAKRFGGVTPPETAWAECFRHIAWPIAHAVIPRNVV